MGLLVDGVWKDQWYDTSKSGGRFEREASKFRGELVRDPQGEFPAEAGRYHLYVSYACPWAHRTLIMRVEKQLQSLLGFSPVEPLMLERGWTFATEGELADPLYGATTLHEIYTRANANYTGRVTVPVLWDRKTERIVSNESADIIRMLDEAFTDLAPATPSLYPEALRPRIDAVNERVYASINNGVYKCGFATTQSAYDDAFDTLFEALDEMESVLARSRYLVDDTFTLADVRLFTTLVRFDAVYVGHFKCNRRRIDDYPNLSGYLRDIYQRPGIAETVKLDPIKQHYYGSHKTINPTGIVPRGPALDFTAPHRRAELG